MEPTTSGPHFLHVDQEQFVRSLILSVISVPFNSDSKDPEQGWDQNEARETHTFTQNFVLVKISVTI